MSVNTWLLMGTAFGLGMFHAIEPGHGKSLITVYLVGRRGTWQDALWLGLSVGFSHTFSILLLGVLAAYFFQGLSLDEPTEIRWLEGISGGLIALVGIWMLFQTKKPEITNDSHDTEPHHCQHKHCTIDAAAPPASLKEIFLLGIASGFCPSPLPVVLLMTALSLGSLGQLSSAVGYLVVYSFGLAVTIALMGVGFVILRDKAASQPWMKVSPTTALWINRTTAILIILLGVYLCLFGGFIHHAHGVMDELLSTAIQPGLD